MASEEEMLAEMRSVVDRIREISDSVKVKRVPYGYRDPHGVAKQGAFLSVKDDMELARLRSRKSYLKTMLDRLRSDQMDKALLLREKAHRERVSREVAFWKQLSVGMEIKIGQSRKVITKIARGSVFTGSNRWLPRELGLCLEACAIIRDLES